MELSKGQSIFYSEKRVLDCLQLSLASLDDEQKECFMDLGLFPEDRKIPVTALIDMWAELYKLDKNGVQAISNLHKLSSQNLLNLVVTRYGGFLSTFFLILGCYYSLQFLLLIFSAFKSRKKSLFFKYNTC